MGTDQNRLLPIGWTKQERIDIASRILTRVERSSDRRLLQRGIFIAGIVLRGSKGQLDIPAIQSIILEALDM